jgi:hypothetical protein
MRISGMQRAAERAPGRSRSFRVDRASAGLRGRRLAADGSAGGERPLLLARQGVRRHGKLPPDESQEGSRSARQPSSHPVVGGPGRHQDWQRPCVVVELTPRPTQRKSTARTHPVALKACASTTCEARPQPTSPLPVLICPMSRRSSAGNRSVCERLQPATSLAKLWDLPWSNASAANHRKPKL